MTWAHWYLIFCVITSVIFYRLDDEKNLFQAFMAAVYGPLTCIIFAIAIYKIKTGQYVKLKKRIENGR